MTTIKPEPSDTFIAKIRQRRNLMSVKEVAEMLGLSSETIYRMARKSRIPVLRLGLTLRFDPQMIALWLEGKQIGPRVR
jgi:excisionase family DNA binding protein